MDRKQTDADGRLTEIPRPTLGGLAVALCALPLLVLFTGTIGFEVTPIGEIALRWLAAAIVVGIAVGVEGRSRTDLGFRRPSPVDVAYLVGTTVAALLVFAGTDPLVTALGLPVSEGAGAMTTGVGVGLAFAGAVTTGVVEEVLYRGYAIERLIEFSGTPAVAGGISWGAFTIAHAAVWPVGNLVQIAAVSGVFTAVYLRRRTLFPVIGSHVLVWGLAVLGEVYG